MRHQNRQNKLANARQRRNKKQRKPTTRLELNRFGNVNGIPDGWKKTIMSKAQLKMLGIPHYDACVGFKRNKYGETRPALVTIIPASVKPIDGNRPNCHLTPEERQRNWERRLVKLTWVSEAYAHEVAEAKKAYKTKIIEALEAKQAVTHSEKRAALIAKIRNSNPLRKLINREHAQIVLEAHKRHTQTDYEHQLEIAHELAENGIIDYNQAKTYARANYKPNK